MSVSVTGIIIAGFSTVALNWLAGSEAFAFAQFGTHGQLGSMPVAPSSGAAPDRRAWQMANAPETGKSNDDALTLAVTPSPDEWLVPGTKTGDSTRATLELRITNEASVSYRFCVDRVLPPDLRDLTGNVIPVDAGRNVSRLLREDDCSVAAEGEGLTFEFPVVLKRHGAAFSLEISDRFGGYWRYAIPRTGRYRLRVSYHSNQPTAQTGGPQPLVMQGMWVGHASSDYSELRIVEKTRE